MMYVGGQIGALNESIGSDGETVCVECFWWLWAGGVIVFLICAAIRLYTCDLCGGLCGGRVARIADHSGRALEYSTSEEYDYIIEDDANVYFASDDDDQLDLP